MTEGLFYGQKLLLQSLRLASQATSLYTREAHYRPIVHLKGVTHYTLRGKECEKEYEQNARTPFVVGRGFISRRFLGIYRLFSAGASPRPTIFPAGKPALWKAPLRKCFFLSRGAEKDTLFSEIFCLAAKCEIMCPSTL